MIAAAHIHTTKMLQVKNQLTFAFFRSGFYQRSFLFMNPNRCCFFIERKVMLSLLLINLSVLVRGKRSFECMTSSQWCRMSMYGIARNTHTHIVHYLHVIAWIWKKNSRMQTSSRKLVCIVCSHEVARRTTQHTWRCLLHRVFLIILSVLLMI